VKKFTASIMAGIAVGIVLAAAAAVPVSEQVTLGASTGTAVSTNAADYAVKQLVYLQFTGGSNPTNVVTVSRIHNSVTTTVGSVTLSSGAGTFYATNAPVYRFKGDIYSFSSQTATGTTCEIVEMQMP
jgi:hypothetical protein